MSNIRTRFAPSPTGFLHIGGVRTTLYAYLLARQNKGDLILRVEDTDQKRTVEGSVEHIISTFKLLGLDFDEGPAHGGEFGPYLQSERKEKGIYQTYVKQLVDNGHAYHCFCTSERLEKVRKEQQTKKLPPKYDRHCLGLSEEEVKEKLDKGLSFVIRMKVPEGETVFTDAVYGTITTKNEVIDDQVLLKSDGFPTYHLAVVVDDHLMEITHVIRGNEWVPSTAKHIILYNAFGWEAPQHVHLPPILGPDGKKKLSKRDGDVKAEDFIAKGYLPEALLNFIALLGWNPGNDQEIMSMDEMIESFSLDRIQKNGAQLDMVKLAWMNGQYIKNLSSKELTDLVEPEIKTTKYYTDDYNLEDVVSLFQERLETITEIKERAEFLYILPKYNADILVFKKSDKEKTITALEQALSLLGKLKISTADSLREVFDAKREEIGLTRAEMFWPIRVAVSGNERSPDLFDIITILGRDESLARIHKALEKLSKM
ncbi:MAG: glutamate--tRNA ligase [Patescibacteria group bacterium]